MDMLKCPPYSPVVSPLKRSRNTQYLNTEALHTHNVKSNCSSAVVDQSPSCDPHTVKKQMIGQRH